ncbi:SDR family NAD(P)-dependent oxidoreductase [Desulfurella sp.]|uniref:SDR family NAD(P)-dependent oxidoreductase n=1 Tax=Desulfurella sp. TaxID=1962857 RepID=UPI0025BCB166|nr:3-oxoacyl-ACP reductase family protein [Desulfurella sp.]
MKNLDLTGKVAIVTGASRGIGASCAKILGSFGANVVVNYFNSEQKAQEVVNYIKDNGGNAISFRADVRNFESVNEMVKTTLEKFGSIDILINNANINFPIKPFLELDYKSIEEKIVGETKAFYNCTKAVVTHMINQKYGKLIYISSSLSRQTAFGFFAHAGAKSAVDAMAKTLALELGIYGIRVNVVGPGLTNTDATFNQPKEQKEMIANFTPLKRIGEPIDVAKVVLFLASDLSDYMSGQYLPVNGGSFMI